jgi:3-hydroxyisobutyrate dehydrogenase-like beta-hydroxyacid dehydrogenase
MVGLLFKEVSLAITLTHSNCSMMASFSEGLTLGKKVGLDPATIVQVLTTVQPWSSVKAFSDQWIQIPSAVTKSEYFLVNWSMKYLGGGFLV